ncbi:oligosaccharide flippase family protein [Rubripirellula reticaptiva]|uniref:Lipopolysaccharide biosynthesis protein WzxC n=1 Tax=Rubripirellula reticaptiva TaxID=2528013 RepID=A0A5C6FCR1_9BACT|nr:oligosaccharide flippase family protein [Rubripirellula reticaptiva]TWU57896.1 Lipopolysaccharide biosynthesis protein WzxC [Rubripirellula reticaptiva]
MHVAELTVKSESTNASESSFDSVDEFSKPEDRQGVYVAGPSRTVLGASAWSMAGYGFSQCFRLVNNMVLSYLLMPEAFGTMAIVNLVVVGISMFSDVGAGPCIIQNDRGDHFEFLNTAWVIGIFRGAVITLIAALLAMPVASFYQLPELVWLIPLASLTALINGTASTAIYTSQRHLDLKSLAWLDIRSQVIGSIAMCILAFYWPTVTSLVLGTIATAVAHTIFSHRMISGYRNQFAFSQTDAKKLFHFGRWIFVSTLMMFAAMQVDRMMMGKLFDIGTLGVYSFGLAIAMLPRMVVEKLSSGILYPVLSRFARGSSDGLMPQLRSARGSILAVGAAMVISVFVTCQDFFEFLYHEDYHAAGSICQWLCLSAWIAMLTMTLSPALVAMGKTKEVANSNFVKLPATIIASLAGFHTAGLSGFILGLAIGSLIAHLVVVDALAKTGMLLVKQDLVTTSVVVLAMVFVVFVQNAETITKTEMRVAFALVAISFWMLAIVQVRQYRKAERAKPSTSMG